MKSTMTIGKLLVASILLTLAACSPLSLINALGTGEDVREVRGIAYGEGEGERRRLDVYAPMDARGAPVVVFFYGGSWRGGARADYAFVGHALAARGIVTVIPDYRVYPEVTYPDFLVDSAQSVAWAQRAAGEYGGDQHRLFVMGHSAGAYNAAMLALDARWLEAAGSSTDALAGWLGLAGPYEFLPIINPSVKPVFHHPDTPPDSQPIVHASAASPPALLIAATPDLLVEPERNTGAMAAKLRAAGVPVTERYYDRVGHSTLIGSLSPPLRGFAPTLEEVVGFVKGSR
ncbi:esterase [Pseudazoarcus pumilus]|uniref:Esterase n=2 Tax=Pseudazoarcus pumilus TaxID=2067960 RepID=A0A2I6S9Z5_9RHOO|nr:esterase [Pseudazoarcus pumilus]